MAPGKVLLTVAVLLLWSHQAGAGPTNWEKRWKRYKLEPQQVTDAKRDMEQIIGSAYFAKAREDRLKNLGSSKPSKYDEVNFADKKDSDRFAPLCKLYVDRPIKSATPLKPNEPLVDSSSTCSCFFVKPDLVMTAAHCFYEIFVDPKTKVETLIEKLPPKFKFIFYVVQQYGLKGNDAAAHKTHTSTHAHIALEVWVPDTYHVKEVGKVPPPWEDDVAFIRIGGTSEGNAQYTLMPPKGKVGTGASEKEYNIIGKLKTMALGYPAQYGQAEIALAVKGLVENPDDKTIPHVELDGIVGVFKRYVCSAIGCGGSGGPWILDESELKKQPADLRLAAFSLTSSGEEEAKTKEPMAGPLVTKNLIKAMNLITELKGQNAPTRGAAAVTVAAGTATIANGQNPQAGIDVIEFKL